MKLWWLDALDILAEDDPASSLASAAAASSLSGSATRCVVGAAPAEATFVAARAFVAMACADGPPGVRERALVAEFVGVDGSVDGAMEWRVYRPREAGTPPSSLVARRVLERMAQIALCDRDDGVLDDSERGLLVTYARAYGVDDAALDRAIAGAGGGRRGWLERLRAWRPLRTRRPASAPPSSPSSPSMTTVSSSSAVPVHPWEVR
jgi:hypothetical protein